MSESETKPDLSEGNAKKRWDTPCLTTESIEEARVSSNFGLDVADLS